MVSSGGHGHFRFPASSAALFIDGSVGAPAGTPQYPTLLATYTKRPAWKVAGVDYPVGIDRSLYPTNATLKDPSSATLPSGCTRDTTNKIFTITGNNVVVDGWDFSLSGGWFLDNEGNNNTIRNCNFVVTTSARSGPVYCGGGGATLVEKNEIDGNSTLNQAVGIGLLGSNSIGTITIQYNWIKNAYNESIVHSTVTGQAGGENVIIQFNAVENAGMGFPTSHGDWIQTYGALPPGGIGQGPTTGSVTVQFNLWLQSTAIANGRTQGLSLYSANSGAASGGVQTETIANNTMIGVSGAYVSYGIIIDTTRLVGFASISANYFDLSGIGTANGGGGNWQFTGNFNGASGGPYNGSVTISPNNYDMNTGAVLT